MADLFAPSVVWVFLLQGSAVSWPDVATGRKPFFPGVSPLAIRSLWPGSGFRLHPTQLYEAAGVSPFFSSSLDGEEEIVRGRDLLALPSPLLRSPLPDRILQG